MEIEERELLTLSNEENDKEIDPIKLSTGFQTFGEDFSPSS